MVTSRKWGTASLNTEDLESVTDVKHGQISHTLRIFGADIDSMKCFYMGTVSLEHRQQRRAVARRVGLIPCNVFDLWATLQDVFCKRRYGESSDLGENFPFEPRFQYTRQGEFRVYDTQRVQVCQSL